MSGSVTCIRPTACNTACDMSGAVLWYTEQGYLVCQAIGNTETAVLALTALSHQKFLKSKYYFSSKMLRRGRSMLAAQDMFSDAGACRVLSFPDSRFAQVARRADILTTVACTQSLHAARKVLLV